MVAIHPNLLAPFQQMPIRRQTLKVVVSNVQLLQHLNEQPQIDGAAIAELASK